MTGTLLNVAGILIGGIAVLIRRRTLSPVVEANLRVILGAFTVFYGLRLTWLGFSGSPGRVFGQVLVAVLALTLGRLAGQLLRLQTLSNQLGRTARQRMEAARPQDPRRSGEGFKACAVLFCAAPLGLVGALVDGLSGYSYPLGVKAVMDGMATMSFVLMFGPGAMLSALPVLAFQGTLTLASSQFLKPFLDAHNLTESVDAVSGLIVFCVALVILGLKKIHLADYLPGVVVAPLLTRLFWR